MADKIPKDLRDQLRLTPVADRISDLEELSKLSSSEQQAVVERIVNNDETVNIALEAIREQASQSEGGNTESDSNGEPHPSEAGSSSDTSVVAEDSSTADSDSDIDQAAPSIVASDDDEQESEAANNSATSQAQRNDAIPESHEAAISRYREILEELPTIIDFLEENLDVVVGKGVPQETAVATLDDAIEIFETVRDAEAAAQYETSGGEIEA